jgi:CO/xanthine dehydrogenase Mo-binding subunit
MSHLSPRQEFPEPERYELSEPPKYIFELNRREFVQTLGAGLIISVIVPEIFGQRRDAGADPHAEERLHIGADGIITVFTSKVEVGQGSRTQLTQAAAEELRVPVERIQLVMADSAVGPNDGGTAGSRTTPSTVPSVRKGCAAGRQLLLEAAAKKFNTDVRTLSVENGEVKGLASGNTFTYLDLAKSSETAAKSAPASGVTVREVSEWTVLGSPAKKINGQEIVTGSHKYPSDITRPGMLYGKILRAPAYGAELTSVNLDAAKSSGTVVVQDGNFVGFAAANSFQAERARQSAVQSAQWKMKDGQPSSEDLYTHLQAHSPGNPRRDIKGAPDVLLKRGSMVLRQNYNVAYIQHAPMEPRAAVAEWDNDKLTVWTGTQQPARVREELARAFNISADRVRVIVPDTGGGFGGKHSGEVAVEAARLAKSAGKPVLVRWTREEEFIWAYYRPAGVIKIAAALDDANSIAAWEQINFNSGGSALGTPYAIPNTASEFRQCDAPLRAGSYRALASTANIFARESMMDELAAHVGENPLAFRLKHLKDERLRNVLVAAAGKFDWNKRWKATSTRQPEGLGLACGTEKGSFAACCVRISVDSAAGTFKLLEITEAYECGAIQNPANLQAQVEGAIIQGLGGAVFEEMKFKDGKISNPRFSQYRVPRLKDMPRIETVLLNRKDLASVGAGETPIIGIAPAIANALWHAAQARIRSLPLRNEQFHSA